MPTDVAMTTAAWHRAVRVALLTVATALAVVGFLALADAYLESEPVVDLDMRVEHWVVAHMPGWAEWLARPFTWVAGSSVSSSSSGSSWLCCSAPGGAPTPSSCSPRPSACRSSSRCSNRTTAAHGPTRQPDRPPALVLLPSGHAATGIAVGGALAVVWAERLRSGAARPGALALGLLVGMAIGASRVVLNVHYLSDVLAGYCVGLAWLSHASRAWLLAGRGT